jgi:hypothetical protein
MKFCTFNPVGGTYTGFYDDEIHDTIPEGAVEIPEQVWLDHINNVQLSYWDGADHQDLQSPPDGQYTWDGFQWVQDVDAEWEGVRNQRDFLLTDCDYVMATDYYNNVLDAQGRTDWETYRQELRDLPETYADDVNSVVWPTPPA